ncbi:C-C motif chemokine 24-like [Symphorus nematophorus]
MSTRIMSIAVVLLLVCSVSCANRRFPSQKFPHPCCVEYAKANLSNADVSGTTYRELSARRHCVDAVILTTTKHGDVCVDPNQQWVQNLIANMTKA